MSATKAARQVRPGRWPWERSKTPTLRIGEQFTIAIREQTTIKGTFVEERLSARGVPALVFRCGQAGMATINAPAKILRGKRRVSGAYLVASADADTGEVVLVHEKHLPCIE